MRGSGGEARRQEEGQGKAEGEIQNPPTRTSYTASSAKKIAVVYYENF